VGRAVVGEVVELVALPHRLRVRAFEGGGPLRGMVLQVEEPDVGRHAAAVALPRAVVGGVRRVREPFAGGRDRAEGPVGNGELLGEAALRRDDEHLRLSVAPGEAAVEEEELAVRRPVAEDLARRVVRDAVRHAARHGERVDVAVAVVIADEGDRLPVRAEAREALHPRGARERGRDAAFARDEPEIVGVDEDDLRRADVREPQHPAVGLDLGRIGGGRIAAGDFCGREGAEGEDDEGDGRAHGDAFGSRGMPEGAGRTRNGRTVSCRRVGWTRAARVRECASCISSRSFAEADGPPECTRRPSRSFATRRTPRAPPRRVRGRSGRGGG
jgi:hypothetical protein